MEKNNFFELEGICQLKFSNAGTCFHVCSQENHPILFHNKEEFKIAMNIVAYVAFLFPDIRIFTFEIMDNHFHFVLSGKEDRIRLFYKNLVSKLSSIPELSGSANDIRSLEFKILPIKSLENLRNVISYTNRNGSVINPDENVFTYKWGGNRYFFNDEAVLRFNIGRKNPTSREKRDLFHSDLLAKEEKIVVIDGYVSPLCFCYIAEAESFFRNSRHYFYSVSRNIEASKDIASIIGENIYYTDEDLFVLVKTASSAKYGCKSIALLPKEAKIELARELHFNYNAGNKQISRILKIDLQVLSSMFPGQK